MKCIALLATALLAGTLAAISARAAEQPVAPYAQNDANAGTTPFKDDHVFKALHGLEGIDHIVGALIASLEVDPRTADFFKAADNERLHRTLVEQFCYVSGGPCRYTGMDMRAAHAHMGVQALHFNALVEHLEDAMNKEGVPFRDQAKLLGKFAPMKRDVVDRAAK
jgi:hemoglobin